MGGKAQKAKRIDPVDGLEYTFAELRTFYKYQYSAKAIRRYWERECTEPALDSPEGSTTDSADDHDDGDDHDQNVSDRGGNAVAGNWFGELLDDCIEEAEGDDDSLQGVFLKMDPRAPVASEA